jgi:hypothetical protein
VAESRTQLLRGDYLIILCAGLVAEGTYLVTCDIRIIICFNSAILELEGTISVCTDDKEVRKKAAIQTKPKSPFAMPTLRYESRTAKLLLGMFILQLCTNILPSQFDSQRPFHLGQNLLIRNRLPILIIYP